MNKSNVKSSVGGDAIYLTTSKLVVAVISLVTSMLLARFRTLSEYGTYSQIIMITDLVSTVFLLGLPNSINYFLAKADTDEEKQTFMSVYMTLSTLMTLVIGLCLVLSIPMIIKYFNNTAITTFSYVFIIYPWSSLMINSLSNTCVIYGKANRLIFFNIIHAVTTLLILLISKALNISFTKYMIVYMISMLLFAYFSLGWIRRMVGAIKIFLSYSMIKEIFIFSIPMGLASVVGTLNAELDKFVIGRFFSTEEYAIFANAAKELPVTILATSITAVLLPRLVKLLKNNKKELGIKKWGNAIIISLIVMSLIVGGMFVFAPDIMSLFYSEKYVTTNGIIVFRIYTLILLFRSTYWGIVLNATGKTRFIFISSILTLVMNFIGNIIGYYCLGFIGPAVSSFIVIIVMSFAQLYFTCRVLDITLKNIFPWKDIINVLVKMIACALVFWIIKRIFFSDFSRFYSIISSVFLGIIWTFIYVVMNYKQVIKCWKGLEE